MPDPAIIPTQIVGCCHCSSGKAEPVTTTRDYNYKTCANEFEFVRCLDCGQIYLKNRPDLSTLSIIYPQNYEAYTPQIEKKGILSRIKSYFIGRKLLPLRRYCPQGSSIMEVGCGSGELLQLIKRRGDPTWALFGVDISDGYFQVLQKMGITTILARFEELQGFENSLDAIIMNQVIEHLADPVAVIRKAYAMLKPGGVLMLETPSPAGWDAELFGRSGLWEGWHAPRHWQVFDAATLSTLAQEAGFTVKQTDYILSPYLWLHSLKNYLEFYRRAPWLSTRLTLSNFFALSFVSVIDMLQLLVRGKTSNMRMMVQKTKM